MVVHGQFVEPAVCLSDLYDIFLQGKVKDKGKITEPWNKGHSDLQTVGGHWQYQTEQSVKLNKYQKYGAYLLDKSHRYTCKAKSLDHGI